MNNCENKENIRAGSNTSVVATHSKPPPATGKYIQRHWKGVHQDWLFFEKKKILGSKWKSAWCAIGRTGMLYLFKKADAAKPFQSIDLTTAFIKDTSSIHTNLYEFELSSQGKCVVKLRAQNDDQKAQWMKSLRETMGKHRSENPAGRPR
eukprot:CAMPEP_0114544416 /NCGR_PEP_ID=MMETSP0114-20121206/2867_1 /TAXON_ID=31324 /ORGANISM="Goniomonas sp, Strain m" /LENGTH=149 /DNA_ID=CAMNT_0001728799 /DNA_START=40 /DNA_END=485 /DNA_ORIENTATION=-